MILNFELDLESVKMNQVKVTLFKSLDTYVDTNTHQTDCFTWTTKVVDNHSSGKFPVYTRRFFSANI